MDYIEETAARRAMAQTIAAYEADPARWLRAVRRIAEALRLDVTRCLPCGAGVTLDLACGEARKQGRTVEQVTAAIAGVL